jgi:hypothetical protein
MKTLTMIVLLATAPLAAAEVSFPTPEAAVDALVAAVAARDQSRFDDLLGPTYREFSSGQQSDPALARARMDRFEFALKQFRSLHAERENRYDLIIGASGWPFPAPIVRDRDGWHFDGAAGVEELRNRIVGANELNAIAALDAYRVAQNAYALEDYDGDGIVEYAQHVASSPGARDGLYWAVDEEDPDAEESPLGPLIDMVNAVLGERPEGAPFLGYRFRVLYGQGAHAKAGAYEYRVNGHMVGGFAMIAWPASYGDTGVMTFIVNRDGVVYQRDLGEDTATEVDAITTFDPDANWTAVDDSDITGIASVAAGD